MAALGMRAQIEQTDDVGDGESCDGIGRLFLFLFLWEIFGRQRSTHLGPNLPCANSGCKETWLGTIIKSHRRRYFFALPSIAIVAAAPAKNAEMISAACSPDKNVFCPISDPKSATPSTLPVCRAELSTPAATPERGLSTLPRNAEVSGGTERAKPPPIAINCVHSAQ
jgi:hypothetical protein